MLENMGNIGDRVKIIRGEKDLTQAQLAKLVGVTQQSIQKIEKGTARSTKLIVHIARALGVSSEWLQFGTGKPSSLYEKVPKGYVPVLEWDEVVKWCAKELNDLSFDEQGRDFIANPSPDNSMGHQFALKIKNNIMTSPIPGETSFSPGSYIVADPDCPPENEAYIIGIWSGSKEAIIRQYVLEGETSYLRPLNPQYPTQETSLSFTPLAVVVAKFDLLLPSVRRMAK